MLLYALRYERDGQAHISNLLTQLQDYGMPRQQLGLVRTMLAHAGADKRVGDLFSNRSFSSRFATMAKQSLRVSDSHMHCNGKVSVGILRSQPSPRICPLPPWPSRASGWVTAPCALRQGLKIWSVSALPSRASG